MAHEGDPPPVSHGPRRLTVIERMPADASQPGALPQDDRDGGAQ